jgi:hypothetical protein
MRREAVVNAIVDMQDTYAKHLSTVSGAKATVDTSAPPGSLKFSKK